MKRALPLLLGLLTLSCGDSASDGAGGGATGPDDGVCRFRVSGNTNDLVEERAELYFDGSTLRGTCLRDFDNGVEIVASFELKAYAGPGQSVTIDESEAWGSFGFDGNDEYRYSIIFGPTTNGLPAECTITVDEGPTSAAPNERIALSFSCARIYGYHATSSTAPTHLVSVSEGTWEATTFQ